MKQARVRFNYHDYLLLPEDKRYEILDGDVCVVPAPNINHQRISQRLVMALVPHVKSNNLGEVFHAPCDVVLSEENVLQPDLVYVHKERADIIGELNLHGAPNLVIEILSAGTRSRDLDLKRKIYGSFAVEEYWIVDPDSETIEVNVRSETGFTSVGVFSKSDCLSSPLLPELKLSPSAVFAQP
jgi:Uma2 family endonuclease